MLTLCKENAKFLYGENKTFRIVTFSAGQGMHFGLANEHAQEDKYCLLSVNCTLEGLHEDLAGRIGIKVDKDGGPVSVEFVSLSNLQQGIPLCRGLLDWK